MVAARKSLTIVAVIFSFPIFGLAGTSPVIHPPQGFEEGTETHLTASQIADILPWATNSEIELKELQDAVRTMTPVETKHALTEGVRRIVIASAPKQTEILMRYILNRALKVSEEIEKEADTRLPGVVAQQVRVLKLSVAMALNYYQSDVEFLNGKVTQSSKVINPPYARFGVEYARFLLSIDNSLIFARAQYNIAVIALGLLQWDLYRDVNKAAYSPAIAKVQSTLASVAERASGTDSEVVSRLRVVKKGLSRAIDLAAGVIEKERAAEQAEEARIAARNWKPAEVAPEFASLTKADLLKFVGEANYYLFSEKGGTLYYKTDGSQCRRSLDGKVSGTLAGLATSEEGLTVDELEYEFVKKKQFAFQYVQIMLLSKAGVSQLTKLADKLKNHLGDVLEIRGVPSFRYECVEKSGVRVFIEANTLNLAYAGN